MTSPWWVRTQFRIRNKLAPITLHKKLPTPARPRAGELEFYRLLLARALGSPRADITSAWDIGCRNWTYAPVLRDYFPHAQLTGVELDGARRYWNLYRRIDQARAQASAVAPADALHADFRAVDLPKDLSASALTSFYPFVSEYPALAWGVPPELSDFREILMKIRTARLILTVHQGEWEAELARAAYRRSGLSPREFIVAPEEFRGLWPSVHPAYGMVVERV